MNGKEAFDKIFDKLTYDQQQELGEQVLRIVYQDLNRLENLEKAIEILKDNLQLVLKQDIDPLLNRKVYAVGISKNYKIYSGFEVTQEQYELIKEVLEND